MLSPGYAGVGKWEFIAARFYSGPMYLKYNAVLRALNERVRQHGTAWNGMERHGTAWNDIQEHVTARGGM